MAMSLQRIEVILADTAFAAVMRHGLISLWIDIKTDAASAAKRYQQDNFYTLYDMAMWARQRIPRCRCA